MTNLNNLNVGDAVYIRAFCSYADQYTLTSVVKKTKTQLTTKDGSRWIIATNCRYGESSKTRGWFHCLESVEEVEQ